MTDQRTRRRPPAEDRLSAAWLARFGPEHVAHTVDLHGSPPADPGPPRCPSCGRQ